MLRLPFATTTRALATPRTRIDLLLWTLLVLPIVHVGLLYLVGDPNSIQGIAVQALRPLASAGAAGMLLYISLINQGRRRIAWALIAIATFFSVLYSTLKITFSVDVTVPFMRVLWGIVYLSAFAGTVAYIPSSTWTRSTLMKNIRTVIGCVVVWCVALALMYGAAFLYDSSLSLRDTRIVKLPTIAFDLTFLVITGVMSRVRPAMKVAFFCVLCILIADVIHFYMAYTIGFEAFQSSTYLLFPLYTLQSGLLVLAAYRDTVDTLSEETTSHLTVASARE